MFEPAFFDTNVLLYAYSEVLYSEDLRDGFALGDLTVVNPFRHL